MKYINYKKQDSRSCNFGRRIRILKNVVTGSALPKGRTRVRFGCEHLVLVLLVSVTRSLDIALAYLLQITLFEQVPEVS